MPAGLPAALQPTPSSNDAAPPPDGLQYGATAIALTIYALPLYWSGAARYQREGNQGEQTQDYISAMRLLGNTSRSIGDLILVYKRVTGLAGGTPSGMGGGRGMQGGSGPSRHLHPGSPATSVRAGSAPGSTHGWLATPRPQATPAA
jgi:hypothetical protein